MEKHKKLMAESIATNKQQCVDFKLNHDKKWEQLAGKKVDQQAKLNGTIMCAHWHTCRNCFKDCKIKVSHTICSKIPPDAKQAHLKWLAEVHCSE